MASTEAMAEARHRDATAHLEQQAEYRFASLRSELSAAGGVGASGADNEVPCPACPVKQACIDSLHQQLSDANDAVRQRTTKLSEAHERCNQLEQQVNAATVDKDMWEGKCQRAEQQANAATLQACADRGELKAAREERDAANQARIEAERLSDKARRERDAA